VYQSLGQPDSDGPEPLGLATVLASLPRREGKLGKMKLSPIAKVLQKDQAQA
jgi:hypothetical protein